MTAVNQRGYSSDSSPDERALRFQYPCPTGQQYQISGITWGGDQTCAANKTMKIQLYNGTTVLQDVTLDCDQAKSITGNRTTRVFFDETSLSDLDCGTTYRLSIAPQESSSGLSWSTYTVNSNADFDAWPLGKETYMSHRVNAGAWTDVTTERPSMSLIINKLNTVSGGGILRGPGTQGGFGG